jgi:UDP-3-O-[3-hydroxymyristoyl] N-acetylglucosamine deacetylase/3-hydroxyacyl-[acyl-carrier-protein] dehydratase
MRQQTICNEVSIAGIGIHSGEKSTITLCPNKENSGIVFQRIDLPNKPKVKALFSNVYSTNRSTNIRNEKTKVLTIEHILASITGENIDNLLIKINNIEVPILDGSSKKFTKIIKESGIKQQNEEKKYLKIKKKIFFKDEKTGSSYLVEPSEKLMLNVKLDYKSRFFKNQIAELEDINKFEKEISSCRTFSLLHEIEGLIREDLIKGGNLDNSIIIVDDYVSDDLKNYLNNKFGKKNITFDLGKLLNKKKLRFKNEPARHKLLDVIGDITLLGKNIKAKITCFKPGHKGNLELVKKLHKVMIEEKRKIAPEINFKEKPFYNLDKIKEILPHREPFIFIDEIRELGDDYIIGVKYVKKEEEYFKGHFPEEPVMPGVLQLETMAQAGGVLILNTVKNPQDYLTFFMKIDNAKFKMKVTPGDVIIFRLNLISPIRRGLCHMHGKGFVDGKIVVEADLLAKIDKKK